MNRHFQGRPLPLFFLAITFPLVLVCAYFSMKSFRNELVKWPAPNSQARADYEHFREAFDPNDVVLISWPGCDLSDTRLDNIRADLEAEENKKYFVRVWSGLSVFDSLREDIRLPRKTRLERIRGFLLSPDDDQTFLIIALSDFGTQHREQVFALLDQILIDNNLDLNQVRMSGPGYNLHQIDMEGFWSPLRAVPLIGLLAFLLTWAFVRQMKLAALISVLSIYTGQLALAIVYLSGLHLNALVWTMPSLVLLLTTSAALHFLGYYRNALEEGDLDSAPRRALSQARKPILYCAVTTSAGLFSLMLSDTRPVFQFGMFGGIAVLASCAMVLSCLPAWLKCFPWQPAAHRAVDCSTAFWLGLANFTSRWRIPIIFLFGLLIVGLGSSIPSMRTSVDIENFFPANSRVVRDANWFEAEVCPLSTIELMLSFENANSANDISRLKYLQYLDRRFRENPNVAGTLSPATFAPEWPRRQSGMKGIIARGVLQSQIKKLKAEMVNSGLIALGDNLEIWRMSIRVSNVRDISLEEFTRQLMDISAETFEKLEEKRFAGESLELTCTGNSIIFDFVEQQFLRDLIVTYGTAYVLISVVILLVMRSVVGVALASAPNLFPAVVVLGGISWAGISLDVGSLMTASIALGIAVDDTLHFVLWWREKVRQGLEPHQAVVHAMQHCGLAMVQTTVVCGVSVALYAFCGFLPTVRFGLLLSAMLFAAIAGDLLLLPAILSTRLGRYLANAGKPDSNSK